MQSKFDDLGRPVVSDQIRSQIAVSFEGVDGRGAILLITDDTGVTRGHLAAKFGEHWKVAGGGGFNWHTQKPSGFVGVEIVW